MEERRAGGIGYLVSEWPLESQKPSIIFIHGAGGSSLFWHDQILGLSPGFNAVANGRKRGAFQS